MQYAPTPGTSKSPICVKASNISPVPPVSIPPNTEKENFIYSTYIHPYTTNIPPIFLPMKKITPSAPAERQDNPSNCPPSFGPRPETLALLSWFARIYTPDNAPNPALPIAN